MPESAAGQSDPSNPRARGETATQALFQLIYHDLRRVAGRFMRRESPNHTLQPTALVHELYLRFVESGRVEPLDRLAFLALAAQAMRHILVDHARRRGTHKRGGGRMQLPLDEALDVFETRSANLLALDQAIRDLADTDTRRSHIVELRFFGGMSHAEIADVLGVSQRTVEREWRFARAWLHNELMDDSPDEPDHARS